MVVGCHGRNAVTKQPEALAAFVRHEVATPFDFAALRSG
jgi:hypothetical protein